MITVVNNCALPTYEIKCPECDGVLHFLEQDENISFKYFENMLFSEWDYYYIVCPICGYEIITREKNNETINDYRKLIKIK